MRRLLVATGFLWRRRVGGSCGWAGNQRRDAVNVLVENLKAEHDGWIAVYNSRVRS